MDWGLKNRLSRIIRPKTGHTVMLAIDHGYFLGPMTKLEKPGETVKPLLDDADALMLTRGVLRNCIPAELDKPMVLRVSGGTSVLKDDLSQEGLTTSMDDAVRLNASAVAMSIFVGAPGERESILNLAELVNEAEEVGMPVLAVTAVGKELAKRDARYLGLACRIAAEHGAHFVKTYYCGGFEQVVDKCPVPCVIAGGPKLETEMDAFRMAYDAIQAGAIGVDMGRNIWQSEFPAAKIKAVNAIVHKGLTAKEANQLYEEAKSKAKK